MKIRQRNETTGANIEDEVNDGVGRFNTTIKNYEKS
jgi:hypothetical protein